MNLKGYLSFIIISFWIRQTLACHQINASCADIKTLDGFEFKHSSYPEGSHIYVYDNGTCIGHAWFGNPPSFTFSYEVLGIDNGSVTTMNCRDITIQSIVPDGFREGKSFVKDICFHFKMIDKIKSEPKDSLGQTLSWIMVIGIGIGMAYWCFHSWKTYLKQQYGETRISGFIIHLTYPCLQKREEREKTRDPPESVHVHSIESEADANTSQSPSLDCNLSNERIQTTKNGDIGAHNASRISHHRSMNRNLREDPGGVNNNKGQDISELDTGDVAGNHAKDHETEGQPLLPNQQTASSDMTGEAIPLANKVSFDRDPVSRCLAVPETDVESKHRKE